jgi:hypothetical protein
MVIRLLVRDRLSFKWGHSWRDFESPLRATFGMIPPRYHARAARDSSRNALEGWWLGELSQ